jgi:hypothetical protein
VFKVSNNEVGVCETRSDETFGVSRQQVIQILRGELSEKYSVALFGCAAIWDGIV